MTNTVSWYGSTLYHRDRSRTILTRILPKPNPQRSLLPTPKAASPDVYHYPDPANIPLANKGNHRPAIRNLGPKDTKPKGFTS
jgi:hypothetical protein